MGEMALSGAVLQLILVHKPYSNYDDPWAAHEVLVLFV